MTVTLAPSTLSPQHAQPTASLKNGHSNGASSSSSSAEKPTSIDLSHHVNSLSKNRHPSPLKHILAYMKRDGMVSLAGGLPHPSLFVFQNAEISAYTPQVNLSKDSSESSPSDLISFNIPRSAPDAGVDLARALQYGDASGLPALRNWARDLTRTLYDPATSDFDVIMHNGNTDAWTKIVRLLCEPGDYLLTEYQTFPSSQAVWTPMNCKAVPIMMDQYGMRSDHLKSVLEDWETQRPGAKKPKLMYIVPVGSNPTGSTMPGWRRKEIYDICVDHDIIICEDDPYTALQYPSTGDPTEFRTEVVRQRADDFVASLVPSFLKYDYQGRVIRLETFSKTLAPGSRLGYTVANPLFVERLLRASEVETQAPCGFAQAIIWRLLETWKTEGYLEWLSGLRDQYLIRRNWMLEALSTSFASTSVIQFADAPKGAEGLISASHKKPKTPLFSYTIPTGGMFIWLTLYLAGSPRFAATKVESGKPKEEVFMNDLWEALADHGVLLTPGNYYLPFEGFEKQTVRREGEEGKGYFRLAFSFTSREEMDEGIKRMAEVFDEFWTAI